MMLRRQLTNNMIEMQDLKQLPRDTLGITQLLIRSNVKVLLRCFMPRTQGFCNSIKREARRRERQVKIETNFSL